MGTYRGLNISGGLRANFKKLRVKKTIDEMEISDRGAITGTPSDLTTKGAGHRRGRNNNQRRGARGATRESVDYGFITGAGSNIIQEHDYGTVVETTTSLSSAAFETRRSLGLAASIADEETAVATQITYPENISFYNSTGIIPAGTPLILNGDGTVSAVTGTIGSTSGFIGYSRYATIPSGYQGGSVSKERMASDSQGNTYIGGYKVQPHPNNPYQQVFFFEKYDSSGNLVWSKEEAGTAIPNATWYQQGTVKAIVCDNNDDVIWSGYDKAGGNPMLVKMDPNGNIVWTKIYDKGSNSGININTLTVDDNNNICGAGVSYMNGGEGYAFKFDTNGNPLWSTEIQRIASGSTAAPQDGRNIHCDSSGNLIILGSTNGGNWHNFVLLKINGSTGALDTYVELGDTNSTARAYSLILDSNDNMYVCGATDHRAYYDPANPSGQHDEDIIVFKFNSSFQLEWQKVIGTPDSTVSQGGRGIEIDSEGNIIAIGYGLGGAIVAKIQQDGTLMRLYNFKSAMSYSDNNNLYHGGGGPSIMMTKTPDDKFYWVSEVGHGDNGVYTNYDALYGFKIADSVLGTYNEENPTRSWVWADVTSTGDLIYQDHTLQTSGSWTTTLTYGDHTSIDTWNTHSVSLTDVTDLEFKQVGFEGVSTTNLTADNYIGFAGSEFSYDGSLGQVITPPGIVTGLSGLVTGADYYLQNDGTISTTESNVPVGTATSTTTLELPSPIIPISWGGDRGITMAGSVPYRGTITAQVDYFDITNPNNNATSFGNLLVEHEYGTNTAVSNKVRAVTAGGTKYDDTGNFVQIQDIQYITIAVVGSSFDFGDLYSSGGRNNMMGVSDGTKGLFAGGTSPSSSGYKGIHMITIASGGNSSSSNSLSTQRINGAGFGDGTYGLFAGGSVSGGTTLRSIDYRVVAVGGSASNFGNLMAYSGSEEISACSNSTYGVIFGGRQIGGSDTGARGVIHSNAMEYVTMATQGDAQDFGTLPVGVNSPAAMSNPTTGVRAGGVTSGSNSNVIEYWQFETPGSAQDFGNLVQSRKGLAGTSGDPS